MILRTLSVILEIIAGFFLYMVCLLAFISEPGSSAKWAVLVGFSVPAAIALIGGLALIKFSHWRRHVGIVLLSVAGISAFLVFSFICMLSSEEFQRLMKPNYMSLFSDYLTGGAFIAGFAALGWGLQKADKRKAEQGVSQAGNSDSSLHRSAKS